LTPEELENHIRGFLLDSIKVLQFGAKIAAHQWVKEKVSRICVCRRCLKVFIGKRIRKRVNAIYCSATCSTYMRITKKRKLAK